MRWFEQLSAAALLVGVMPAQQEAAERLDPVQQLASTDSVAIDSGRRRLCATPRAELPTPAVVALLDSANGEQRRAATAVLAHHGLEFELLRKRFAREADVDVRVASVTALDARQCADLVEDSGYAELAFAAFRELARRGNVTDDVFVAGLICGHSRTRRAAAQLLVRTGVPVSARVLAQIQDDDAAVSAVLAELSLYPRASTVAWLDRIVELRAESPFGRVEAYAAYPRGSLSQRQGRDILTVARTGKKTTLVIDAAGRLDPSVADNLVNTVHRMVLEGFDISVALEVLDKVTLRGERHLLSLSRGATAESREAIVDWLGRRESPAMLQLIRESLEGDISGVEPFVLRRAGPLLTTRSLRLQALEHLRDGDDATRAAAFHALVNAGIYDQVMLEYVFEAEDDSDLRRRTRGLTAIPNHRIEAPAWQAMLDHESEQVRVWALRKLFDHSASVLDYEREIIELAQEASKTGVAAMRLVAMRGRSGAVQELWPGLPPKTRVAVVTAFKERQEQWVRELLAGDEQRDAVEFQYTLVWLGDRSAVDRLIADPTRWSISWVRRAGDAIARALRPEHLEQLEAHLIGERRLSGRRRLELIGWIVARPDLDRAALLERIYENDPDLDCSELALEGLLATPRGARVRGLVANAIGASMDEDADDLAHAVIGATRPPLNAEQAALIARMLLVAPLGDAAREIYDHLAMGDGDSAPGTVLVNMAMQSLRADVTDTVVDAFMRAAEEARAHPDGFALGRGRLGRILTDLARVNSSRARLAPWVARLILESHDKDRRFVGPAELILAEHAESRGEWSEAVERYERAELALVFDPPAPFMRRVFLADDDPGIGVIPSAWLAARPGVCRARADLAKGAHDSARGRLDRALHLARGDEAAENEIRTLLQEIPK